MLSYLRSGIVLAVSVMIGIALATLPSRAADESKDLRSRIRKLEKTVATLEAKLDHVQVIQDPINGLAGPHVIFEGCNVHVRSGSGSTNDGKSETGDRTKNIKGTPVGLGNLIVGYNEAPISEGPGRGGSHNLIVGPYHHYSSLAGVVFGSANTVSNFAATVTGGIENIASEDYTNVSGGARNIASGYVSSVNGGDTNVASGSFSSVAGGAIGEAFGRFSIVGGGYLNEANGEYASVSGGQYNTAGGNYSSVCGGYANSANSNHSSISGGSASDANGEYASVSGGYANTADGDFSSVSGGYVRTAPGELDWTAGLLFEDF